MIAPIGEQFDSLVSQTQVKPWPLGGDVSRNYVMDSEPRYLALPRGHRNERQARANCPKAPLNLVYVADASSGAVVVIDAIAKRVIGKINVGGDELFERLED